VPQFVVFGSDDNPVAAGNNWLVNTFFGTRTNPQGTANPATFDGTPARGSFYLVGNTQDKGADFLASLRNAYLRGHEIGNHTFDHLGDLSQAGWLEQIRRTQEWISRPVSQGGLGVPAGEVYGFRTPFDHYNTQLYAVLDQLGFTYDASIVEGFQPEKDGTNDFWPYRLTHGSPGAEWLFESGAKPQTPPGEHPELWEVPASVYRVPPDLQARYGERAYGCDWNWIHQYRMRPQDMVRVFKYTLDLRLKSNRAPLHLCIHGQIFGEAAWQSEAERELVEPMREALSQMIDYALSQPEVRVVRAIDLLRWLKSPVPLGRVNKLASPVTATGPKCLMCTAG